MPDDIYNDCIKDIEMENQEKETIENNENKENNEKPPLVKPRQKSKQELLKEARCERLAKAREKLRQMQEEKNKVFQKKECKSTIPKDLKTRKIEELNEEELRDDTERRSCAAW